MEDKTLVTDALPQEDEEVLKIAKEMLDLYKEAFQELAK